MSGDPIHLAKVLETLMDGSTKYEAGQSIMVDNDMTASAQIVYENIENPDPTAHTVPRSDFRGYDGGEYKCQSERTCAAIEAMKAKEAEL